MSLKFSLALIGVFLTLSSSGQLVIKDSLVFNTVITSFSQDRTGNILIALAEGRINKYSKTLDSLNSYSPSKVGDITLLEAWHGFQIFAFYREFQEFLLIDRFLTRDPRYDLDETDIGFIELATISSDQNLWLVEENGLRLIKLNLQMRTPEIVISLEPILGAENHNFLFLREYQNMLFLVDKFSGIYVFDNLGNYIRKIPATGLSYCSFYNDQLIYISASSLFLVELYKDSTTTFTLPSPDVLGAVRNQSDLFLFMNDRILRTSLPKE